MSNENARQGNGPSQAQGAPQGNAPQGQGNSQAGSSQSSGAQQQGYAPSDDKFTKGRTYQDDPEWKRAQAGYTRTINELQQQLAAVRNEQERQRMSGMSELEQARYAAEQWRVEAQNQAMRLQEIQAQSARMNDLRDIQQATGVPVEEIAAYLDESGSNSAHDAWTWAYRRQNDMRLQGGQTPPAQGQQTAQFGQSTGIRNSAPPVNVGGGPPPGAQSELQAEYDRAREQYNMGEMFAVMQKAGRQGVELREW